MKKAVILCVLLTQMLTTVACRRPASRGQGQVENSHEQPAQAGRSSAQSGMRKQDHQWRAATYQGLTMGQSTRSDMLRVFGPPEDSVSYDEGKPTAGVEYFYKAHGDIRGELVVAVDKSTDTIFSILLRPERFSKAEAIKLYGEDYVVMTYDFDECLGDGGSAPLYESPGGNVVFLEYRDRGIAIAEGDDDEVNEISYVSEPIGAPKSRCKENR